MSEEINGVEKEQVTQQMSLDMSYHFSGECSRDIELEAIFEDIRSLVLGTDEKYSITLCKEMSRTGLEAVVEIQNMVTEMMENDEANPQ